MSRGCFTWNSRHRLFSFSSATNHGRFFTVSLVLNEKTIGTKMENLDRMDGMVSGSFCVRHTVVTTERVTNRKLNSRCVAGNFGNTLALSPFILDVMINYYLIRRKSGAVINSYKSEFYRVLYRKAGIMKRFERLSMLFVQGKN